MRWYSLLYTPPRPSSLLPPPRQPAWAFQASLTVSCPCPVFSRPAHTNSHGSNMLSHANCYGILSPCWCPSPQGLPLGRFREENGIFQVVRVFRDLLFQPSCWMDGNTGPERGKKELPTVTQKVHQNWPSPRSSDFQPICHTASQSPCPTPTTSCLLWTLGSLPLAQTLN